jgi:hypothetical protein
MFACIREEVDSTSNKSKEDRVVINGLKSATPLPTTPEQEKIKKSLQTKKKSAKIQRKATKNHKNWKI